MQACAGRYGRERIDVPLVIASLDVAVRVFFLDDAGYDLLPGQTDELAWTKLWGAAVELGVELCVLEQTHPALNMELHRLQINPIVMSQTQMAAALSQCRHLIHV